MQSKHEIFDVELTALVYGGDALGRLPDRRAVFVPYAIPGELVRLRLLAEKKGHARAELMEVLRGSAGRIPPRCVHFQDCGGCHYQHIPYDRQLEIKRSILIEQFQRITHLDHPPVDPVERSMDPWNYRNTIQFHLNLEGKIGFLAPDSHRVVPIQECHLPESELNEIWPLLDLEPLPSLDRIELRVGADGEVLLVLEGRDPKPPEFSVDMRLSAVYLGPEEPYLMAGDDFVIMQVLDRQFKVSAGSFFQVNIPQAEAMVQFLLDHLDLTSQTTILDLYSGVGLFSAFFAAHVARCVSVEISPWACDDFAENLDEFDNVDLYIGEAGDVLPGLEIRPEVIVVDPPRAGLDKLVVVELIKMQPNVIAYVSCDPSTLARDASLLISGGYTLEKVTPFDLFPQTFHIESISIFRFCPIAENPCQESESSTQ